jgi:acyl-CoA synthetase (AMP-forming)/AMP-acid ligase II
MQITEEGNLMLAPSDASDSRTFWAALLASVEAWPSATMAVGDNGETITFAEFKHRTEEVAAGLAARGVGWGTRVAWQLPTQLDTYVIMMALSRLGATQIPLLHSYRQREVGYAIRQASPELIIVPGVWRDIDYVALAKESGAEEHGCDVLVTGDYLPSGDPASLPPFIEPQLGEHRWIYYTSGTTGVPKGVRHRDASLLAAADANLYSCLINADDRVPILFPVAHVGGAVWLGGILHSGCCALIVEVFDLQNSLDFLDANGVTVGAGGTVFIEQYLKRRRSAGDGFFSQVRAFLGGASPKVSTLHAEVFEAFGGASLLSSYGMTECPIMTYGRPGDTFEQLKTEGRMSPGVDIAVARPDGSEADPGQVGEISVRAAPQLFLGYLGDEDGAPVDDKGWFRTGDLGFVDADGYVSITGRLKDVIIRKGENISARELEDLLVEHPAVADVAVVGIPDEEVGERCCAIVVLEPGSVSFTFDEMVAYLRTRGLMPQKLPERLSLKAELPRNATGKVIKQQLRDELVSSS